MDKEYVLFDLDGTLTDPAEGITNSARFALGKMGLAAPPEAELLKLIGPPLQESFGKFGLGAGDVKRAIGYYREYFGDKGIFENRLYPGIPGLLERLRAGGKTLALATSKATVFAERILVHFGLDGYFSFVGGSELDGTRVKKAEVIAHALENLGARPCRAVMVGDREHDIIGARETGVESIGVLYGFGGLKELSAAGAGHIVRTVEELGDLLL